MQEAFFVLHSISYRYLFADYELRKLSYKIAEAARSLGINANMLGRWVRQAREGSDTAFPGKGNLSPEQEEIRRLREENKRLRMEKDILKKATAFFAKEGN